MITENTLKKERNRQKYFNDQLSTSYTMTTNMKLKFSNFLIFLTYHDCAPNSTATRSDGGNLESIPPDHIGETSFHVSKT